MSAPSHQRKKTFSFCWPILLLVLGLATGCSSVDVRTVSTPQTDLTRFHTFNCTHMAPSPRVNELNERRFKDAVIRELKTRGFKQSDQPELDFEIFLETEAKTYDKNDPKVENKSMSANLQEYYGFLYDKNWSAQNTVHYTEGRLIVHAVDTRTKELVWEGVAKGVIYENRADELVEKRIREAMSEIFKTFPHAKQ